MRGQTTRRIFLICSLLACPAYAWAQTNAVTALAIDPTTPTTLYAATSIGVFKSTDAGATWFAPTASINVTSLSIDPRTPSTIYTNAYKSMDGGTTWAALTLSGSVVIVDPNNPPTLYAGTGGGLVPGAFRSIDAGVTWTDFSQGLSSGIPPHVDYGRIQSLAIDPQTSTLFASFKNGGGFAAMARRPQTSTAWQTISLNIGTVADILSIAIHPSNSQVIYATVRNRYGNNYGIYGILKSVDGGSNWNYSNAGLPISPNATAIAIDPTSPSTLYAGLTSGIFKSIDGGDTWATSGDGFASGVTVNALAIDPSSPSTIYAATSIGVYKSSDSGGHWNASNQGLGSGSSSAPTLTSVSPASAPQDSIVDLSIAGFDFTAPFGLNFGRGISVLSVTLNSATSITARIQVARDDAALGIRDVTLTTASGTSNGLSFTVTPGAPVPPNVTSVSPASARQNSTVTITFTGTNFTPSMTGAISGNDVTLSPISVTSSTSATAVMSVGAAALVSTRSLQLSTLFGGPGNAVAFDVTWGVPVISAMSPPFVLASHTTTVTFTGIRLVPPLSLASDADIRIDNVSTDSSFTSVTASITVPENAKLGTHSIAITSNGMQSSTPKFMVRSLTRYTDFNGDGNADLLWYNAATGETAMRLMNGTDVIGSAILLSDRNWKVIATGDFNGDGKADLIWYNATTGQTSIWLMNGTDIISSALLVTDSAWHVVGVSDFDGDGKSDLLWSNGLDTAIVLMDGTKQLAYHGLLTDAHWKVIGTGDFREGIFQDVYHTGEGFPDLLWNNTATNETVAWLMSSFTVVSKKSLNTDPAWSVTAMPDLNGDGKSDLIWYNSSTGQTHAWILSDNGTPFDGTIMTNPSWRVRATADLDGDNKADLIWYNSGTGQTVGWLMNGPDPFASALLLTDPDWKVTATGDFNNDGKIDLVWTNDIVGYAFIWLMNGLSPSSYAWLSTDPNWKLITPIH